MYDILAYNINKTNNSFNKQKGRLYQLSHISWYAIPHLKLPICHY
jgi:hypothetical protein